MLLPYFYLKAFNFSNGLNAEEILKNLGPPK